MKRTRSLPLNACCSVLLVTIGALVAGCNSGTTADVPQPAEITLAVSPNPVPAEAFTPPPPASDEEEPNPFRWRVEFVLTISETAGVGANIESVLARVNESSGGIVVETGDVLQDFTIDSQTNRLDANGSITITFEAFYALPNGSEEALIVIDVFATDDNGFEQNGSIRVPVN